MNEQEYKKMMGLTSVDVGSNYLARKEVNKKLISKGYKKLKGYKKTKQLKAMLCNI